MSGDFEGSIERHARYALGRDWPALSATERLHAVALAVRDRLVDGRIATQQRYRRADAKCLYYLSIEFLIGQSLGNNLINLGLREECRAALHELGCELEELEEIEPDAALGNGGLGRLAACYLDSLATLGMPGFGYGINYEYGLFKQEIDDGYQREKPENWLAESSPWQIERPEAAVAVPIYGRVERSLDRHGNYNPMWLGWRLLIGVPHDMLIPGYSGHTVNYLRLYSARSSHDFDMGIFNDGDYFKAVQQKIASETISMVLYPSDAVVAGHELRLVQEYFLVACTLRDILRRFEQDHTDYRDFSNKVAIQMNDTHPSLAVAELMRILVDEKDLEWDAAWQITQATLAFTNHTILPEALEKWPVPLLEHVLPRHLEIIYEINRRLLLEVDAARAPRVSLIEESSPKQVRMANLAVVGSHSINGVARIHTELLKTRLFPDFYHLWPERFNNKTNGVTQRRWMVEANGDLSELITKTIGEAWITDLDRLRGLEKCSGDASFQSEFRKIKRANKQKLGRVIYESSRVAADPDSLFDVQVKRIHAYKRQLLNVMHIVHEYLSLLDGHAPAAPRTYLLAGKAAPGYWLAKQIIKLIHDVGRVIDGDGRARQWMKVTFLPDYRVSLAEKIIPAADLSEQISTAGTEASGTGNMKMAMNGALTLGTMDGANIEIRDEVGAENMFTFGLDADEVQALRRSGYHPREFYDRDPRVKRVADALTSNLFGASEWMHGVLFDEQDAFVVLADLAAYLDAQDRVSQAFQDGAEWSRKAILNVARMGKFSGDRAVREYARDIWRIEPV